MCPKTADIPAARLGERVIVILHLEKIFTKKEMTKLAKIKKLMSSNACIHCSYTTKLAEYKLLFIFFVLSIAPSYT